MKETKRQRQASELIKRNFGIVLQAEGSYIYDQALVTVTNVKISPDFGVAKVYLSVYNTLDKQSVILLMRENYVRLRHGLGERIRKHIRRIPQLEFFLDDTLDEMYRLNELFDKMEESKQFGSREEE
jgi:ribosome-binding factor A